MSPSDTSNRASPGNKETAGAPDRATRRSKALRRSSPHTASSGVPGDKGYVIEPTIFTGVDDTHKIAMEEIFGPVLSVMPFKNVDDVLERGNKSFYGLAAAIWTRDIGKAHRLAAGLRTGTVWINCYDVFDAAAPFGGFKMSGIGRELGEYALRN